MGESDAAQTPGCGDLEERWARLTECFLNFSPDPRENIDSLTALCGSQLGATCALYNRLCGDKLVSWGQWQTPEDYDPVADPEGHICYDVITSCSNEIYLVRDLPESPYADSDPSIKKYRLQTYLGTPAMVGSQCVGSLCVVFQRDFLPSETDKSLLRIVSRAIGVEEKRLQAERELNTAHLRLLKVLDGIEAVIYVADMETHELLCMNKYAQDIFGNGVGKKCWEVFQRNQAGPCDFCVDPRVAANRPSLSREMPNTVNGRWYNMLDRAIDWIDGRTVRLQIAIDITERKMAEESLREREATVRAIFRTAPVGITLVKNRRFQWLSESILSATGYSREDLLGKSTRILYENDEEFARIGELTAHLRGQQTGETDTRLRCKDGRSIDVHLKSVLFDTDDPSAGVVCSATDITESKRQEKALVLAEQKWEQTFDAVNDPVMILDRAYRIVKVNKAMAKILALPSEECVGKRCYELVHGRNAPPEFCPHAQVILDGRPHSAEIHEPRIGGDFLVSAAPICDDHDEFSWSVFVLHDITALKKNTEERELLFSELQEAMRQIKTLKGIVPICSYCKKIRDDDGYWQRVEKYISEHTEASFTHGICPECYEKEISSQLRNRKEK